MSASFQYDLFARSNQSIKNRINCYVMGQCRRLPCLSGVARAHTQRSVRDVLVTDLVILVTDLVTLTPAVTEHT